MCVAVRDVGVARLMRWRWLGYVGGELWSIGTLDVILCVVFEGPIVRYCPVHEITIRDKFVNLACCPLSRLRCLNVDVLPE